MLNLIEKAHAATGPSSMGETLMGFTPFIAIFVVMYFLIIRPNQKREKQRQEMLGAVKRGDKVLTAAGFIATVSKVSGNDELVLELADNVKVNAVRSSITQVLSKTEPSKIDTSSDKKAEEAVKAVKKSPAKKSVPTKRKGPVSRTKTS